MCGRRCWSTRRTLGPRPWRGCSASTPPPRPTSPTSTCTMTPNRSATTARRWWAPWGTPCGTWTTSARRSPSSATCTPTTCAWTRSTSSCCHTASRWCWACTWAASTPHRCTSPMTSSWPPSPRCWPRSTGERLALAG